MEGPDQLKRRRDPPGARAAGVAVTGLREQVRATLAQFGLPLTLLYASHRILQRLSGGHAGLVCYALYAQPVGAGQFSAVRGDSATVVVPASETSSFVAAFPRPSPVVVQRFAAGARCFVVTVREQFGGYIWVARTRHDEDEVRCRYLLPDVSATVWDFDVYVEPHLRLGRTLGRLWKAVDAELAREGVRWSFSRISRFNRASVATHERLGAIRVGFATFLCLGPVQIALLSNAPYLHLSIGASPGPSVRLRQPRRGAL